MSNSDVSSEIRFQARAGTAHIEGGRHVSLADIIAIFVVKKHKLFWSSSAVIRDADGTVVSVDYNLSADSAGLNG